MKKTRVSDLMLIALNAVMGVAGLVLLGYGFNSKSGVQGVGLILVVTSILAYVGIRSGIEQQENEEARPRSRPREVEQKRPPKERFKSAA